MPDQPSPNWRGLFGSLFALIGVLLMIGSGLCTAGFGLSGLSEMGNTGSDAAIAQGVAGVALVIGLPSILVGYGLYRLGRRMRR